MLDQKEVYWRQRSKQFWPKSGDKNTRYFHATATTRKKSNQMLKLQNSEGLWQEWGNGLEELITNYYSELFTTSQTQWEEVIQKVPSTITQQENELLLKPVTQEEVKVPCFQCIQIRRRGRMA